MEEGVGYLAMEGVGYLHIEGGGSGFERLEVSGTWLWMGVGVALNGETCQVPGYGKGNRWLLGFGKEFET